MLAKGYRGWIRRFFQMSLGASSSPWHGNYMQLLYHSISLMKDLKECFWNSAQMPNTCLILFNPIPQMLNIQQTIPWFIFGSSLGIEYWGDGIDFLMGTLVQLFPRQGCPQLEWAVLNPCSLVIPSPILHPHIKHNRDHGLAGGFTHIWDMLGPFASYLLLGDGIVGIYATEYRWIQ